MAKRTSTREPGGSHPVQEESCPNGRRKRGGAPNANRLIRPHQAGLADDPTNGAELCWPNPSREASEPGHADPGELDLEIARFYERCEVTDSMIGLRNGILTALLIMEAAQQVAAIAALTDEPPHEVRMPPAKCKQQEQIRFMESGCADLGNRHGGFVVEVTAACWAWAAGDATRNVGGQRLELALPDCRHGLRSQDIAIRGDQRKPFHPSRRADQSVLRIFGIVGW